MRSSLSDPASPSTLNFQGVTVSLMLAGRGRRSRRGTIKPKFSLDQPRQINHLAPDGVLAKDRCLAICSSPASPPHWRSGNRHVVSGQSYGDPSGERDGVEEYVDLRRGGVKVGLNPLAERVIIHIPCRRALLRHRHDDLHAAPTLRHEAHEDRE